MHSNFNKNTFHTNIAIDSSSPSPLPILTSETDSADTTSKRANGSPPPETATISVLLVDDHALMREGLKQLLDLEEDISVIGEAGAVTRIRQLRPDVVLMDIRMPIVDGIAVTHQLLQECPTLAILMLTMQHEEEQMLQALRYGARGYLLKSASSQEVAQAIRTAHAGGMLLEPQLTGAMVHEFRRLSNAISGGSHITALSEKDIDILRYVATGMSNKEIAERLAYSEKTVKNYLSVIFQKLGMRDRTQAAIFALRHGLLPEE